MAHHLKNISNAVTELRDQSFITIPLVSPYAEVVGAGKKPVYLAKGWPNWEPMEHDYIWKTVLERASKKGEVLNMGLCCGEKSQITVVDIDKKEDGLETWNALCKKHGEPATVKVQTGSGGFHYYFNYVPDLKTTSNVNKVGIDIRNNRGYCAAPPSIHASTQKEYVWCDGKSPLTHEILDMPEWLLTWLMPPKTVLKRCRPKKEGEVVLKQDDAASIFGDVKVKALIDFVCRALPELDRAEGYDPWIRTIWFAQGFAESLDDEVDYERVRDACIQFSMQSDKHDDDEFEAKWETANTCQSAQIGIGTFIMWSKEDCPLIYQEYRKSLSYMEKCPIDLEKEYTLSDYLNDTRMTYDSKEAMYHDIIEKAKQTFVVLQDTKNTVYVREQPHSFKELPLKELTKPYSHKTVSYSQEDEDGKTRVYRTSPFMPLLLSEPALTYRSVCVDPTDRCPPDTYNLWTGFKATCREELMEKAYELSKPMLDHMFEVLCAGSQDKMNWLLSHLINILFPKETTRTGLACIFIGDKGVGKNVPLDFLRKFVIGERHSFNCDTITKVTGQFNGFLNGCIFTVIDELATEHAQFHTAWENMKNMITADIIPINAKGKEMVDVPNLNNYFATSNSDRSARIEHNDRRYSVFECSSVHMQDLDYFDNLCKKSFNQECGDAFLTYLKMVKDFGEGKSADWLACCEGDETRLIDARRPIQSSLRDEIINQSRPKHELFFDEFLHDEDSPFFWKTRADDLVKLDTLYSLYLGWFDDNHFTTKTINKKIFTEEVKKFPRLEYKKSKSRGIHRDKMMVHITLETK